MRVIYLVLILSLSCLATAHADERLPIPDAAAQKEADKLVKEVFGKEFESSETPDQKSALTRKLLQAASRSDAKPQGRYALLKSALDVAPDASVAMLVVDEMAKHFQIDILEAKAYTIRQMSSKAKTSSEHLSVAKTGFTLMKRATGQDRYDYAVSLGEIASNAATRAKDFPLLNSIREEAAKVATEKRLYDRVQVALAQLETDPTDANSNLIVGKYKCFVKGKWDDGLPMLALGDDEALKLLATKELMGAKKSSEQMALADGWWELSEAHEDRERQLMRLRASHWYQQALPKLVGLEKQKAETRLTSKETVKSEDTRQSNTARLREKYAPDALQVGDHYYKLFWKKDIPWTSAIKECEKNGRVFNLPGDR